MDLSFLEAVPFLGWVVTNFDAVWPVITAAVALASAITALTPTPNDDAWVGKIYKVLDWAALNIFKAKDKPGEGQ